ncbi:D-cysteine desulfhydrase [Phytopseudomonas dryadis]|uniref:L-cysteate sulfo-lyase n=1 Tax=Phytopseudomonas dryadis TaxID=2487520 RepID=A0A4Q9RBZ6_9GAMM|nr:MULTISPECIES: D-cysteine desulfhydrase [Pseudomonas]TBU97549.1 D-cysteine desulfhydrase [Pseudomonas dryadis]TBV10004.1 D-cysteine desulfhydrase [Pseudomonas dryadis]TBV19167.1 D-cysteine desulfhydrase [Pseudomonas sp. FRB 230]
MISEALSRFPRLDLVPQPTPLQRLERLSRHLGRDVHIKRDDLTPFALGGNKARKLEFLGADALGRQADTLITAGAIQSNHVRQTAALAAQLGLACLALLENPIASADPNYLHNGNRLLLELFATRVEAVASLDDADGLLAARAERLRATGKRPYVVPIGGSNALGTLGYVKAGLELAEQISAAGMAVSAVVLASGSGATHAGVALALAHVLPQVKVIGVTVSRSADAQRLKVAGLVQRSAELLGIDVPETLHLELWDGYFAPRYGEPNAGTLDAIRLLAGSEGLLLDPVYTGKAFAGLLDGLRTGTLAGDGALVFLHTGGSPALFAYHPSMLS